MGRLWRFFQQLCASLKLLSASFGGQIAFSWITACTTIWCQMSCSGSVVNFGASLAGSEQFPVNTRLRGETFVKQSICTFQLYISRSIYVCQLHYWSKTRWGSRNWIFELKHSSWPFFCGSYSIVDVSWIRYKWDDIRVRNTSRNFGTTVQYREQ